MDVYSKVADRTNSESLDLNLAKRYIPAMPIPSYPPEKRREIAHLLRIDEQYLYQITRGLKTASPALAKQLNQADPAALLWDLRPDDWYLIWPELIGADGAPQIKAAEA